jgi:hypothetical protein
MAALSPFSGAQGAPSSLLQVPYYSVFFVCVCVWVFLLSCVSLSRRLCWFIRGVAVGVSHAVYLSPGGLHLRSRLGAGVWRHGSPPGFSVYVGVGKLCASWGFKVVGIFPPLDGFSCQVCLQRLSKIFTLQSSRYLLCHFSCHLGTSFIKVFNNHSFAFLSDISCISISS